MRRIFILIFLLSFACVKILSQDVKPEDVKFKIDTSKIKETKNEFILPEFVITGRETIEVEIGEKIFSDVVNLPDVDFKLYKISYEGKITPDVSLSSERISYLSKSVKNPVAKFKAGIGRYTTTYFDGMIQGNVFKNFYVNSNFKHRASQGFIDNADYVKNQFSVGFDFEIPKVGEKFFHWVSNARISPLLSYSTYSFGFYGSSEPSFHRNINDLNLALSFESPYHRDFDYVFKFDYSDFTLLDTISRYEGSSFEGREKRIDFGLKYRQNVDFLKLMFDVEYTMLVERYLKIDVSAGNLFEFFDAGKNYDLRFGVKFFSFENYDRVQRTRIYPSASFKYLVGRSTQIYASFSPEVLNQTIADYIEVNRFLTKNLNIVRAENYFNLAVGVKYGIEIFGFDAGLNFKAFKNFPIYMEHKKGFYGIEFERAQFIELKSSGYLNYGRSDFTFNVSLLSSYNARSKKPVPYYPNFSANLGYSYKFAFGLAINSEISLISSRVYDFEGSELRGFALVNLGAEFEVLKNFKIFANFDNLFSQRFYLWNSYLEPNFIFIGGIEYKF